MKILLLGGTAFVGRHITSAALARGHEVTHFNRGKTDRGAFTEVRTIVGDRDGGLGPLKKACKREAWDAVVDTSGYLPRVVADSIELLRDRTSHYTFVSSISAYADLSVPGVDEDAPLAELEDPTSEELPARYGPLKTACERVVQRAFEERGLVLRPGLIVGPHDPTDRFTYWPVRLARGGTVLAPAPPDQRVQWIDARDLAEWTVRLVESRVSGVFNAVGPGHRATFADLIEGCRAPGVEAEPLWVNAEFLHEHEVGDWLDLPLWVTRPHTAAILQVSDARARAAGLTCRPLEETARDTLAWARTLRADHTWDAGLSQERERELVEKWRASRS